MPSSLNLSDPQAQDLPYDIESMRRFAGIELLGHNIPEVSTILRFRHLREQPTELIFVEILVLLEAKRLLIKSDTIADAIIIAAPPSTKNEQKARDPETRQTKKDKDPHFGMKAHVGSDRRGIVHSLSTTAATCTTARSWPPSCTMKSAKCLATKPTGLSRFARPLWLPMRYRLQRAGCSAFELVEGVPGGFGDMQSRHVWLGLPTELAHYDGCLSQRHHPTTTSPDSSPGRA
jgi:IS5 family transposase